MKKILKLGPYNIQFDTDDRYDFKQENEFSATAKAKGSSSVAMTTVSLQKNDPTHPLKTDAKGIVDDTKEMAIRELPKLSSSTKTISTPASGVKINVRNGTHASGVKIDVRNGNRRRRFLQGFHVRVNYYSREDQKKVAFCERAFCPLDAVWILDIFSVYPADDTATAGLVTNITKTIQIEEQTGSKLPSYRCDSIKLKI
jgi:hypothetical protein